MVNSKLFGILFFMLIAGESLAQCFSSPGNPIGGTANLGLLDKQVMRTAAFYRHSYSDKYLDGSKDAEGTLKCAHYDYSGILIGYGLRDKVTVEAELGYFIDKTKEYKALDLKQSAHGLSNAVVSAKFPVYQDVVKRFEFSLSAGIKIPMANKSIWKENVEMPIDIQPSTGSYGLVFQSYLIKEKPLEALRFFMVNRFETNFKNNKDFFDQNTQYKFGNIISTSLFVTKHLHFRYEWLTENWTAIIQVKNEIKTKNKKNDEWIEASGGYAFYLCPQLNYSIKEKWNVSLMYEMPIYQHYNEVQLAAKYAFVVNVTRDFVFY